MSIESSPFYDPRTLRLCYPPDMIEKLPVKKVSESELFTIMQEWEFNPTNVYYQKVSILHNEVGCDDKYRYVV